MANKVAAFIGTGKLLDPHFETRTFRLENVW